MKYLSTMELSKTTGIPRTTVRRRPKEYEEFFITDLDGERVVYHPQTLADLSWVQKRREEGMPLTEIKTIWIKDMVRSANDLEKENARFDAVNGMLRTDLDHWRSSRDRWRQTYNDLHKRIRTANLWQRIFKTW